MPIVHPAAIVNHYALEIVRVIFTLLALLLTQAYARVFDFLLFLRGVTMPHNLYKAGRAHMRHTLQEVIEFIVEIDEFVYILFPLRAGSKLIITLRLLLLIRYGVNLVLLDV